jgi:hypothetical protein
MTRIYTQGSQDFSSLAEGDRARFFMLERAFWVRMQNVFSQWRRGTLNTEDWELYEGIICTVDDSIVLSPDRLAGIERHRIVLTAEFFSFVTGCNSR